MYRKQTEAIDHISSMQIHEGRGLIKRRNLFKESSRLPISLEIWEFDQGVSEGNHTHKGGESLEEIYYFLEGQGVMTVNGEEVLVSAGDAIMVPPGVDHGVLNAGPDPLKVVIIWGEPAKN